MRELFNANRTLKGRLYFQHQNEFEGEHPSACQSSLENAWTGSNVSNDHGLTDQPTDRYEWFPALWPFRRIYAVVSKRININMAPNSQQWINPTAKSLHNLSRFKEVEKRNVWYNLPAHLLWTTGQNQGPEKNFIHRWDSLSLDNFWIKTRQNWWFSKRDLVNEKSCKYDIQ